MKEGKVSKTVVRINCYHKFFVFVNFHLSNTEPDSPMGVLYEGGRLFVREQLDGGFLFEVSLIKRLGLIESLRYNYFHLINISVT